MNIERFQELVDEFGERPADWPVAERDAAVRLLETSHKAREIVAEAADMRELFARSKPIIAPAGLADKIVILARDSGRPASSQLQWFSEYKSSSSPKERLSPRKRFASAVSKLSLSATISRMRKSLRSGRPNYVILWLCFTLGLGLGLGFGFSPMTGSNHIDFATMFAVVGS